MQDKKELRKHFSAIRKRAKTDKKDMLLCEKILSLDEVIKADLVLLFASFGSEPDTWRLAETLLNDGKMIAFPRCNPDGQMTFHLVDEISILKNGERGKFDICEPDISMPTPEFTGNTICIVPGLAFTEEGGRLGYGGGYYDRFLSAYPDIRTIAVAYEDVITDSLPLSEHDVIINKIVTEERTVLCNE